MKILIDGMGGDNAPEAVVKGVVKAAADMDPSVTLGILGPEDTIKKLLKKDHYKGKGANIEVINCTEVIDCNEAPAMAVKRKKNSTIVVGMDMLRDKKADVFISAGSTGALLAGGLLHLGRIHGIKRPGIAAWIPKIGKDDTTLLLDCGASVETKPEYLLQYGIMGSLFVKGVKGIADPDVRLLNIGAEEAKGDELHKEAYQLLKSSSLNFCGNIEGRDVVFGDCDVIVTDGFSGNIFIKGTEGMALAIMKQFKKKLSEGTVAKAGAMLAYNKIKEIKNEFDYSDVGGAPILGLKAPVLKIHGNSDERDVYYAIRKAVPYVENNITGMITDAIAKSREL